MKHVFFKPWVGKNYHNGGIFGKKILVLGEGHVCGGCDECGLKFAKECVIVNTNKTIELIISGYKADWTPTYRKFERSLVNHDTTPDDSKDIWNSVAFFNFLQIAMTEARKAGSPEEYDEGRLAFLEVIDELQPDLIIVWGIRLWKNLPRIENGWIEGEELLIDRWKVPNGYYKLTNEKKARIIAVWHPSSGYSWDWWYKVISTQL